MNDHNIGLRKIRKLLKDNPEYNISNFLSAITSSFMKLYIYLLFFFWFLMMLYIIKSLFFFLYTSNACDRQQICVESFWTFFHIYTCRSRPDQFSRSEWSIHVWKLFCRNKCKNICEQPTFRICFVRECEVLHH